MNITTKTEEIIERLHNKLEDIQDYVDGNDPDINLEAELSHFIRTEFRTGFEELLGELTEEDEKIPEYSHLISDTDYTLNDVIRNANNRNQRLNTKISVVKE